MFSFSCKVAIALLSCLLLMQRTCVAVPTETFPVIDLGYARHAPTKVNQTALHNISYATYSNIRFAQPPIGELRFRRPKTPPPKSFGIEDGIVPFNATNCLQAIPRDFTVVPGLNGSAWGSEDCLFLDVIVPEGVTSGANVPVLHWIYGGGFFLGAKDNGGNPAALFNEMSLDEKFIVVASNYRLGALGWMSSDREPSIESNAGLYDVWTALEWTQDNIHRFGGDRNRVTAMGQSAGSGMIDHLIAASSQGRAVPFSQAITSSPGYRPHVNRSTELTEIYEMFLNRTTCTSVNCLRDLGSDVIADANKYMFLGVPQGPFLGPSIGFGPVIDGDLVKEVPTTVLLNNTNSSSSTIRRILTGGMKNDGGASLIGLNTTWKEEMKTFARTPTNNTVQEVKSLYANWSDWTVLKLNGLNLTTTPWDTFSGDVIYGCHSVAEAIAYSMRNFTVTNGTGQTSSNRSSTSYRYDMSIPPAFHGQDLSYYFYDEIIAAADPSVNSSIASQFQGYLRRFILGLDLGDWPEYSSSTSDGASWMNISAHGFEVVEGGRETSLTERCETIYEELILDNQDGW